MVKKELSNIMENFLKTIADDGSDSFSLAGGACELSFVNATRTINELQKNHGLDQKEIQILGEAALGAALSSVSLEPQDTLSFSMDWAGICGGFQVEINGQGELRGYLKDPAKVPVFDRKLFEPRDPPSPGKSRFTRYLAQWGQKFSGELQVDTDSLAGEFARYMFEAQKTKACLNLNLYFDRIAYVRGAGAVMLTAAEDCDPQVFDDLAELVLSLPNLGELLARSKTGATIVHDHFADYEPRLLSTRDLRFNCRCEDHYRSNEKRPSQQVLFKNTPEQKANEPHPHCLYCGSDY